MKQSVSVVVLQPLEYKGRLYTAGESVDLKVIEAIALAKKHQVTLTRRKAKPVPPLEPIPEPEPPKRRYRRRDLQAEETAVLEPQD